MNKLLLFLLTLALASCGSIQASSTGPTGSLASSTGSLTNISPTSCHTRGTGLYALPDPQCTPGATNPNVTQANIQSTICKSGWTSTVRPPESVTEHEKYLSMAQYGYPSSMAGQLEYDHLIPLELGGATNSYLNLWPEIDYPHAQGFDHNPKDELEYRMRQAVCSGKISLAEARQEIATNWVSAYDKYVGGNKTS